MFALTYHGLHDVRYERAPDPVLVAPGDALLRVMLAGICGSDLHVWHGRETGLDAGTVMGHEFVGEVVEAGADVRGLRPGQRVVAPFTTSCGTCYYCRAGLSARCVHGELFGWVERGRGLHGAQAELVRVPLAGSTLVPLPATLRDTAALLLGDVLATGYHAACLGDVEHRTAVVVGCGPVGLMAVLASMELDAEHVFAVDAVPERLAFAERLGATPLPLEADAPARLRDLTEGRGADAVLECVGSAASARLAFDLVRPGGTIAAVGVHHEPAFPFSPGQAYDRNLTYRTGRCPARSHFDELLPLAERRATVLESLFTHRLPLAEGPMAYRLFDEKRDGCLKVALVPG